MDRQSDPLTLAHTEGSTHAVGPVVDASPYTNLVSRSRVCRSTFSLLSVVFSKILPPKGMSFQARSEGADKRDELCLFPSSMVSGPARSRETRNETVFILVPSNQFPDTSVTRVSSSVSRSDQKKDEHASSWCQIMFPSLEQGPT